MVGYFSNFLKSIPIPQPVKDKHVAYIGEIISTSDCKMYGQLAERAGGTPVRLRAILVGQGYRRSGEVLHHNLHCVRVFSRDGSVQVR